MISPPVGRMNLVRRLKQVVLPAPFGPINAWMVPRTTRRLTPLTATKPANSLVRLRVSRMISSLTTQPLPRPPPRLACRGRPKKVIVGAGCPAHLATQDAPGGGPRPLRRRRERPRGIRPARPRPPPAGGISPPRERRAPPTNPTPPDARTRNAGPPARRARHRPKGVL